MERDATKLNAWETAGLTVLGFLLATNLYRAWTQSITADEAFTYHNTLSWGLGRVFTTVEVNNHVLQSALSWISFHLFGLSEFSLRLPTLLGGALYFAVVWRISRFCFGRGPLLLLSVVTLSANPFVLDYLSAARGYGLGLGFFFWAFEQVLRFLAGDRDPARLYRAGVGLGLSIAANLVFVYPSAALGAVLAIVLTAERRGLWQLIDGFAGPAVVTAFVIAGLPASGLHKGDFYYGAPDLSSLTFNLADLSFANRATVWQLGYGVIRESLCAIVLPLMAAALVAAGLAALWRWPRRSAASVPVALTCGTLGAVLAVIVTGHKAMGILYPQSRTAIYFVPLFTLGCLALIRWLPRRMMAAPLVLFLVASAGAFALGFAPHYYYEWKYDSATKRTMNLIREREAASGRRDVALAATSVLEFSTNFYRKQERLEWMRPVPSGGPDRPADYYLLLPRDYALLQELKLNKVFTDPVSELILATPK